MCSSASNVSPPCLGRPRPVCRRCHSCSMRFPRPAKFTFEHVHSGDEWELYEIKTMMVVGFLFMIPACFPLFVFKDPKQEPHASPCPDAGTANEAREKRGKQVACGSINLPDDGLQSVSFQPVVVVVGKHFTFVALCGLVVEKTNHLTAKIIIIFAPQTQRQAQNGPGPPKKFTLRNSCGS